MRSQVPLSTHSRAKNAQQRISGRAAEEDFSRVFFYSLCSGVFVAFIKKLIFRIDNIGLNG